VRRTIDATYRHARRVVITVVGGSVVAIGIALLVLPGPAFIVIPIGLGILGLEFAWARRWLETVREHAKSAIDSVKGSRGGPRT
jgi:tellurite resistance protein TerC